MEFLEPGNFNGLTFRKGMVYESNLGKWLTYEEYREVLFKQIENYKLKHNE